MSESEIKAYSDLLLDYCLDLKPGQKLFIQSTTLAEPLIAQVYEDALERKSIPEISLTFKNQEESFNRLAHEDVARWVSPAYRLAMESFDAYLFIRAPFESQGYIPLSKELQELRREALMPYQKWYSTRTGSRAMRRTLCQYPTIAGASEAGMSLEEYSSFVVNACFLHCPDPAVEWKKLSKNQNQWVSYLNQSSKIRYVNRYSDITFSVQGRTWVNSDGQTNMPSGEIYTSPVEDSVNGNIFFDYPVVYQHRLIQGIRLEINEGTIQTGTAVTGQETLNEILEIPGARRIGEAAIGTNTNIERSTKNILFDEKISGSVHLALGQSYEQCGGKNESSLHLDLIADMKEDSQIFADGLLIYQSGKFLI